MMFGPVQLDEAVGTRLGHSVRAGKRLPKGHVVTGADVDAMREAGLREVVVARFAPDDVEENEAAAAIAAALATPTVRAADAATGRCNLYAERDGLFVADREQVDALNAVDPGITLATLADATPVRAGRMVATVKIIPFAVPQRRLQAALARAAGAADVLAYRSMRVAMISTTLPTLKDSVISRTEGVTRERLKGIGAGLVAHERVPHAVEPLAKAVSDTDADLTLVFGASAVADVDDVVPAAIRAAGGSVERVGMPVDPGNLLCFGRVAGREIIGAPGCARSPVPNGFDWALQRLAVGLPLTGEWVRSLGVGGLLMESGARPIPRENLRSTVEAIVLAAGRSRRMGADNKLTLLLEGKPVVAHAVDAVVGAGIVPVVVTGHDADAVREALTGRDVRFVHNAAFAAGMSTSLKAGLSALDDGVEGAMVVLGDMPFVTRAHLDAVRGSAHTPALSVSGGALMPPAFLPARLFASVLALGGDRGAAALLRGDPSLRRVAAPRDTLRDIDVPEDIPA